MPRRCGDAKDPRIGDGHVVPGLGHEGHRSCLGGVVVEQDGRNTVVKVSLCQNKPRRPPSSRT